MKPLIVANWKMNPLTLRKAKLLFNSVKRGMKKMKKVEVVICPPFPFILSLKSKISNLELGAQDCFWEEEGAFTGEISPAILKNLEIEYVIIGHSERRRYFSETDGMINKKLKAALKAKLKSILCIGETAREREKGQTLEILKKQLCFSLKNLKSETQDLSHLVVAYEPVWAIGTGNFCPPEKAKEVLSFLQKILKNIPILYGGSVDSQNGKDYIEKAGFQGLLVGGASLKAQEFIKILKSISGGL